MATQDDILTVQKNSVVAQNSLTQAWQNYSRSNHGASTSACVSESTVVSVGVGQLVSVSVVTAGDEIGYIYDAASLEDLQETARLKAILKSEGIYPASFRFSNGLVVAPGKGQAVTITYSMD
jgi:hypothetical protein